MEAEALQASEYKWRVFAENSPDYVMLLNRDADIEFINRSMLGYTVEPMTGTSIHDYVPAESKGTMKDCFERVLKTSEFDDCETEYHTNDGSVQNFAVRVGPVKGSDEIVGLAISAREIVEGKRKE
jgi:PAS domain S-box-containing protein